MKKFNLFLLQNFKEPLGILQKLLQGSIEITWRKQSFSSRMFHILQSSWEAGLKTKLVELNAHIPKQILRKLKKLPLIILTCCSDLQFIPPLIPVTKTSWKYWEESFPPNICYRSSKDFHRVPLLVKLTIRSLYLTPGPFYWGKKWKEKKDWSNIQV